MRAAIFAGTALVVLFWHAAGFPQVPAVRSLEFEGAVSFRKQTLTQLMQTRPASLFSRPPFSADALTRDLDNLTAFYLSQGFLNVRIEHHPPVYSDDSTYVDVRITIQEGPRWAVSLVEVTGAGTVPEDVLRSRLRHRAGEPYRPVLLNADQRSILDLYAERSHMDARLSMDLEADHGSHSVSIRYDITEGPPASVARITVRGIQKTRLPTVWRELEFHTGDRFDLERWGRSQSNLYNTGLFESVWIEPSRDDLGKADKEVLVLVTEKPRWEFSAGVGYGRFDEARLVAAIRQGNFLGRGIRWGLEGKVSRKTRRAEFLLSEPWLLGRRIEANTAAVYSWRDEPEFLAETVEGGIVITKGLRARVLLESSYRLRRTALLRLHASATPGSPENRTSILGGAVSWKMRDDLFNTTRGFFFRIEGEYAGTFLGGTNQFLRANLFWRHFLPLPPGVVVALRSSLGAMTPLHSGGEIPINERYFMGGDQSVRGYPRHSLGPSDASGNAQGARRLAEFSQELRVPFARRWMMVIFADEGILFDVDPDPEDWAVGVGGGLRIVTPLGVLRGEIAWGRTEKWGRGREYYLSVGQAF